MFSKAKRKFDERAMERVITEISTAMREFSGDMARIEDERAAEMTKFAEAFTRALRHLEEPK